MPTSIQNGFFADIDTHKNNLDLLKANEKNKFKSDKYYCPDELKVDDFITFVGTKDKFVDMLRWFRENNPDIIGLLIKIFYFYNFELI